MKILMLGWELPPHNSGGLGTACYQLCKALFTVPFGEWLQETDVVHSFYKEGSRSFYDAVRLVNQRVERHLKIKKLLIYDASRVQIRAEVSG